MLHYYCKNINQLNKLQVSTKHTSLCLLILSSKSITFKSNKTFETASESDGLRVFENFIITCVAITLVAFCLIELIFIFELELTNKSSKKTAAYQMNFENIKKINSNGFYLFPETT